MGHFSTDQIYPSQYVSAGAPNEIDFQMTSVDLEDLHNAFADKSVKGIITVIGGFNSIQLLEYLDWGVIKNNPKIFCGFSDITALNNAVKSFLKILIMPGSTLEILNPDLVDLSPSPQYIDTPAIKSG